MFKRILATAVLATALAAGPAAAERLQVAATTTNMAMITQQVGGEHVEVTTMAPPDRDAHYLEARPSMMAALRGADLVVSVGAELEEGWLPAAIRGANNPDVQIGQDGYFEAAAQVELIGQTGHADRARGDVHPAGNPHVYLDPVRMAEVGQALASRLGNLAPEHAEHFYSNADDFQAAVEERLPGWEERVADAPGVLLFHADIDYLVHRLDVPLHGYLEPLPGVPPTARHLRRLVNELADERGVTLFTDFQPADGARFIERELGWSYYSLPTHVPVNGDADDYFAVIDELVEAIASPAS
ncbi:MULTISPECIES: metal ABC transporter substrate-binding protein [unclassified Halorhodospira]|uniref:metal ABC transporter substrate-binding protein n=1 Tax=unclassified Halorhodospira TaxID=2626748 RepID=UPI001EE82A34|nr:MULTISPECIES: metal ABC transporter substrate-binding protein [unclassified Halorhodospira]MCG5533722.1 metal ABC transporter substrate-binding protein [Halorhodospira sp. 9621]MCG5541177.1 metal ABC transporter substrate-binding protein [Halorhodospira sp. M39old]MCG5545619.1 metal ABC transporter substrate-binding protein [Halorhodospira sp. M38]